MTKLPKPIEDGKRDNALSYGRSPSSPASIKPEDIQSWIKSVSPTFSHYFEEKYEVLKKQWEDLVQEYYWNKSVYEAEINFTPTIGNTYYLYQRENGSVFLSLLPLTSTGWKGYIGAFKLTPEHSWTKVDDEL